MLSQQTPWHVRAKEALTAAAWKKIATWLLVALVACAGSLAAFGRSAVDFAVQKSGSYQELKSEVESLKRSSKKSERTQKEFFGAMMDVNPALREAVESRASASDAAQAKRIKDSLLLDRLGGE